MARTIYVFYSVLDPFEIPEDWTDKEINDYFEDLAPEGYNDIEYVVKEG